MQFKEIFISDILNDIKTQTRRIVKEGDYLVIDQHGQEPSIKKVYGANGRIKYQVGKDYSIQTGRGKKGLWWCPSCITQVKAPSLCITPSDDDGLPLHDVCINMIRPIRIKITDIKKEKLLDINLSGIEAEGFENRYDFIKTFFKVNNLKLEEGAEIPDFDVWKLTFEVLR